MDFCVSRIACSVAAQNVMKSLMNYGDALFSFINAISRLPQLVLTLSPYRGIQSAVYYIFYNIINNKMKLQNSSTLSFPRQFFKDDFVNETNYFSVYSLYF